MTKRAKLVAAGAAAAVLAVGAGAAVAGGGLFESRDAFTNDVARRLNVTPEELKAAFKGAYDDQVDAAVKAGKITKEQGERLKARAAQGGGLPLLGGPIGHGGLGRHGGPGPRGGMTAAAGYLALTEKELHTKLEAGKTLAQIAKDEGKTVAGLKAALTADAKKKLAAAVKDGRLTQAQADAMLERLSSRIDDMVEGKLGPRMRGGHGGGPLGHGSFGGMRGGPPQGPGPFTPVPA